MSSRDNSQGDEVMENDRSSSGADPFSQGVNRQNEDGDDDREERVVDDDDVDVEEEEEEGEDLMDMNQMREDYRAIDAMDHYGEEGIDDAFADQRSEGQLAVDRRAADVELDRRDRRRARGQRLPGALAAGDEEDDVEEARRARRRRRALAGGDMGGLGGYGIFGDDEDEEGDMPVNLQNYRGKLSDWIDTAPVQREVKKNFMRFLKTYVAQEQSPKPFYPMQANAMCRANLASLEVSYMHLSHAEPVLSIWVADVPKKMLALFGEVAKEFVLSIFPRYDEIHDAIYVRVKDLPISDALRDIRQVHLNVLVKTSGVVTRRTNVLPQVHTAYFTCMKCQRVNGPFHQDTDHEIAPSACIACQSRGPFELNAAKTTYRNFQKITLQEPPNKVPPGRLPRTKEVTLVHDLIDNCRPGEEIELTGIYTNAFDASLNTKLGFPVFSTVIEANHIHKVDDVPGTGRFGGDSRLSDADREEMAQLSRDPKIGAKILRSIAPSIYGHHHVKAAIALSLFGGQEKVHGKHRVRGDINILLLGDPGTAKSQFLKYVEKVSSRAVYTTGKGASAVGLTASVHKDSITREWTLEGGALVMADRGTCLIDEFDKMNEQDRVSIHEAMEQQSISISKAGIVTSLQARCAVVAAANPIGGRYNPSIAFHENVELTEPILSRFDCLCVIRDTVDPSTDERLARFVVESHAANHPVTLEEGAAPTTVPSSAPEQTAAEGATPQTATRGGAGSAEGDLPTDMLDMETLKKYILYAKSQAAPKLSEADVEKLANVYAELRRESANGHGAPIAVRHLESMIRMAEAHARMHLRSHVTDTDVDFAIRIMLESFIGTQKYGAQASLTRRFRRFLNKARERDDVCLHALRELMHWRRVMDSRDPNSAINLTQATPERPTVAVGVADFESKLRECAVGAEDAAAFYDSAAFKRAGYVFDHQRREIRFQQTA
ncbi:DNA replication licensing factor MCM8 subunit [Pycnococcus provasolii]